MSLTPAEGAAVAAARDLHRMLRGLPHNHPSVNKVFDRLHAAVIEMATPAPEPEKCLPPEDLRGVDGAHWITGTGWTQSLVAQWRAARDGNGHWAVNGAPRPPALVASWGWRYAGPVATLEQVAALKAEIARQAERFEAIMTELKSRSGECATLRDEAVEWRDKHHALKAEMAQEVQAGPGFAPDDQALRDARDAGLDAAAAQVETLLGALPEDRVAPAWVFQLHAMLPAAIRRLRSTP